MGNKFDIGPKLEMNDQQQEHASQDGRGAKAG
jgi:hypothetical protein